jgi:Cd2+/Zn2+-exporting ATPase
MIRRQFGGFRVRGMTAAAVHRAALRGSVVVAALLAGVLFGGVTMALGMLVHEASVLIVIGNAMRLLRPTGARSRRPGGRDGPGRRNPSAPAEAEQSRAAQPA